MSSLQEIVQRIIRSNDIGHEGLLAIQEKLLAGAPAWTPQAFVLNSIEKDDAYPEKGRWIVRQTDAAPGRLEAEGLSGVLSSTAVAQWFRKRANGVEDDHKSQPTWAPAAWDSIAEITIGGTLGPVVARTEDHYWDGNDYSWYDLEDVPVGGFVYRVSARGTFWAFECLPGHWEASVVEGNDRKAWEWNALLEGALTVYQMTKTE